ncbi:luciferin 4-monooxygenase [Drosophila grimshawi]|uniref:GH19879 n=1 Tax=Drosophila grimshawi TaxID=7222 RepID=B4J980_DROGR|nr:luciferin 4-monooxygenase [Drosophila grimshawi]EDW02455.1 GH19879 [Drosophila grimshawi]
MASTTYDEVEKIWSGPKGKEYYGPDMTLGEVALLILKLHADSVMQVLDPTGECLTGGQLYEQSRRLAHAFKYLKLNRGDVVGISASNTTYLTEVVIAALLSGTPINPLHPDFDKETVAYMYEITKPKIIFCDQNNYKKLAAVKDSLKFKTEFILISGSLPGVRHIQDLLEKSADGYDPKTLFACPQLRGDDTAFIISSSGVNDLPKGVTRSHRSLLDITKMPQLFTSKTVVFCFSPMYWISCIYTMLVSLVNGCKRVITNQPFSPEYFAEVVARHKISFMLTVPHHMAMLAKSKNSELTQQLQSLQAIVCCGSKLPLTTWRRLYDLLGSDRFHVLYGLSEIGGVSKNVGGPLGCEGKLLRNVQVRILDEHGNGLGPNQTGHIHVHLNHRWGGYYRNPQDTQTTVTPDAQWLLTGDYGFIDEEGFLHFQTRDSEVFKYNQFHIFPKEIEDVILHLPGVHEAAIFGVPDDVSTNLTACAVVCEQNEAGKNLTVEQIISTVAKHLSEAYHLRGGVYFMEQLPKTTNKKIQRRNILSEVRKLSGVTPL